jgi:hypothetical protein
MNETKNNSGVTGTLAWNLTDGIFTINGTGAMPDYSEWPVESILNLETAHCVNRDPDRMPWRSCRESITTVIIGKEITSIGKNAFCVCHSLTSLVIPPDVTFIDRRVLEHSAL